MFKLIPIAFLLILPTSLHSQSAAELRVATAESVKLPLLYELDGVVEARYQATLSSELAGRIETISFDVADKVKKGEIIVKIRDTEYRARRQAALASLKGSEARLREAELEFKRTEDLYDKKLIAASGYEKARALLNSAQASVEIDQTSVIATTEQLDKTTIRAPYSGVVLARHIEPGETLQIGQKIMSGYAEDKLRISFHLPQSFMTRFRQQPAARVLHTNRVITIPPQDISIYPVANASAHSFQVRLNLADSEIGISPGMLVKVSLEVAEINRLLIPASALVRRSEVSAVYIIDEKQGISLRQVRPGGQFDERIEILAGLDAGEQIALEPLVAAMRLKNSLVSEK